MGLLFKDSESKPLDPAVARKRATLFSLPFAAMGMLALILLLHDGLLGGVDRQKLFKLLGVLAASIGFIALIFGVTAKKGLLGTPSLSAENPEKPWLKRADWAAGRVQASGIPNAKSYLTMGIGLCVLGGLIAALVVPKALPGGNYSALVALVFPIVGVVFLVNVVLKFRAHRRFGDCYLTMAQTPAQVGGTLAGAIQTSRLLKFDGELRLDLRCIRQTTTGAGQNRRTEEKVLWQEGKTFPPQAEGAGSNSGRGGVPVCFDLPPGQPQCSQIGNEAICWRLEMKIPGANFYATFDVPVFKIVEPPVAGA